MIIWHCGYAVDRAQNAPQGRLAWRNSTNTGASVGAGTACLAAQHLNYLILPIPLNEAMFAVQERHSPAALRRWADEAVRVWLAAYGTGVVNPFDASTQDVRN